MIDVTVLDEIRTLTEACERCYLLAGFSPKRVAAELGIPYNIFTRMFNPNDPRNFPPDLILPLMVLCGNVLPLEWLACRMEYALHEKGLNEVLRAIAAALAADGKSPVFCVGERGLVARNDVGVSTVREGG